MAATIPPRLMHRPRDHRGYVIPFVQFIADDGTPNFAVMDAPKVARCLTYRLCGLCGEQMGRNVFFVGGPLCVVNRYFYDPPMHKECAICALEACPHLARSKGRYREVLEIAGAKLSVGTMETPQKADYFALMHTNKFEFGKAPDGMLMVRAAPWLDIEYWKDGEAVGPVPPLKETTP